MTRIRIQAIVSGFAILSIYVCVWVWPLTLAAQTAATVLPARAVIRDRVDEHTLHTLAGNTRSQAIPANDRGQVPDAFAMDHMMVQLQRPAEQEQALRRLIDSLHDPKATDFHRWLTPDQFGQAYGLAQADIDAIRSWLESHGFTVNAIYPSRMLIDFSGTAGQVRAAFHTEIHHLDVNGE